MTRFRRYQLKKDAVAVLARHPWIFREQMSTASQALPDGAWLRLFDGANQIVGYGMYEAEGAIAVRILRRGTAAPDAAWVRDRVAAAIARRAPLGERTTAYRVVNGESDELPAVVIDKFGDALVVQSYSLGADALARYAACVARASLGGAALRIVSRSARRRRHRGDTTPKTPTHITGSDDAGPATSHSDDVPPTATSSAPTGLRGQAPDAAGDAAPDVVTFSEDGVDFSVDLGGQKSGAYLDLRGLRRALADQPLANARVLNLFSYSGMLGRIAERAGAATIVQVDQSQRALDFARAHHVDDAAKHELVVADAFAYEPEGRFQVAIVDPPSMTSSMQQIPTALAAYRKLYARIAPHVAPGGLLVAACCTSRIARNVFRKTISAAVGEDFSIERELRAEPDHPIGFPQADYLKIVLLRRRAT